MPAPRDSLTLSHMALRSPSIGRVARFYADIVGMVPAETGPGGELRLGWGSGHHAVELVAGHGFDHFALEAEEAALTRFAQRLDDHGVAWQQEKPWGDHPTALVFEDPDGNRIELHGPVDRSGERAGAGVRPIRIHHLTFASPDVARMIDFYVEVLGFRISDQMEDVFTWVRSNHEHHTVAVVQGPSPGLDHFAFEVGSWAELGVWCDELARREVPLTWGPGRHGPGNNLFVMFDDTDGRHVELSCEMERFWDELADYAELPRRWRRTTRTVNLWGPVPDWRGDAASGPAEPDGPEEPS
jgi:catechol 2,3-dioxygenase-like lactoylglutathione lyase family enzyme